MLLDTWYPNPLQDWTHLPAVAMVVGDAEPVSCGSKGVKLVRAGVASGNVGFRENCDRRDAALYRCAIVWKNASM